MTNTKLIYLVWKTDGEVECTCSPYNPSTCVCGEDEGYWDIYSSLEDAATSSGGVEIFTARPRLLGKFKMVTKPIRIKSRKKKK